MTRRFLAALKEMGAVSPDAHPMKPRECDLSGGVPIIDIPTDRGVEHVMVYDNVTSQEGTILMQGKGTQYAISVSDGTLQVAASRNVEGNLLVGIIGSYPADYYKVSEQFVRTLDEMCR